MKQLIRFSLLLLALLLPTTAYAYDFEVDGIYYNYYYTDAWTATEVYVTSGTNGSYSGSITIPKTVTYNGKTYSVIAIGNSAFKNRTGLTSINIPNTVTSIGESAFYYCI